ncbi:MAG: hypothetical protein DPW11_02985 [bacterium]|nr:DeoR family transcriptional regulator [Candidatus Microgenomates bacterium CPR3]MCQ3944715.1 hypothetical protein [bacterium]RIK51090.1 MAG: hypothetical protein DCC61_03850 [Candidatus Microgenomates bacterium]
MTNLDLLKQQLELAEIASRLLPRRQAIYQTIKEQRTVSADYLARNFAGTPSSTLRYDLKQLQKAGLIKKLGTTRGALYQPV